MRDVAFAGATELLAAMRAKQVSSRELLDVMLRRIEEHNPRVNAVVTLDAEGALEAARVADDATARGEPGGPLHGLPMTVKDAFETAAVRTTCGDPELADHVPSDDAVAVARLKAAGAIVFGKTNTPIQAGDIQTANRVFGATHNPWDTTRIAGGSSGGSAAALAAGLSPLELGSDIGGSIRNPSHFCGVSGHKPSWGVVPERGHIPGPPGSLTERDVNVTGPMARCVADLSLGLDVLAGPLPDRAVAWSLSLPPPRAASLGEYRIAAWLDDPASPVSSEVAAVLGSAVDRLSDAGAKVTEVDPPVPFADAARLFERMVYSISTAFNDTVFELSRAVVAGLPPVAATGADEEPLAAAARIVAAPHHEWFAWVEERERMRAAWARFFEVHDVVLAPVINVAAFVQDWDPDDAVGLLNRRIDVDGRETPQSALTWWCGVFGVVHLPVTVVPVGLTAGGLPVGVQVVGPYLEDRTTLHVAALIESALGGFTAPPGF